MTKDEMVEAVAYMNLKAKYEREAMKKAEKKGGGRPMGRRR